MSYNEEKLNLTEALARIKALKEDLKALGVLPAAVPKVMKRLDEYVTLDAGLEAARREQFHDVGMYDFILTEGDLRHILDVIGRRRLASEQPYCLQIHIELGQGTIREAYATAEHLSNEMIRTMREKGEIDWNAIM